MTDHLKLNNSNSQSAVILEMERKLNSNVFYRRFWKTDKFCKLSTGQYWDWLTYLDVRIT